MLTAAWKSKTNSRLQSKQPDKVLVFFKGNKAGKVRLPTHTPYFEGNENIRSKQDAQITSFVTFNEEKRGRATGEKERKKGRWHVLFRRWRKLSLAEVGISSSYLHSRRPTPHLKASRNHHSSKPKEAITKIPLW